MRFGFGGGFDRLRIRGERRIGIGDRILDGVGRKPQKRLLVPRRPSRALPPRGGALGRLEPEDLLFGDALERLVPEAGRCVSALHAGEFVLEHGFVREAGIEDVRQVPVDEADAVLGLRRVERNDVGLEILGERGVVQRQGCMGCREETRACDDEGGQQKGWHRGGGLAWKYRHVAEDTFFQSAEKPRMVRHAECQTCGLEAHAGIKAAEALLPELTSSTCAKKGIHEIKEE